MGEEALQEHGITHFYNDYIDYRADRLIWQEVSTLEGLLDDNENTPWDLDELVDLVDKLSPACSVSEASTPEQHYERTAGISSVLDCLARVRRCAKLKRLILRAGLWKSPPPPPTIAQPRQFLI